MDHFYCQNVPVIYKLFDNLLNTQVQSLYLLLHYDTSTVTWHFTDTDLQTELHCVTSQTGKLLKK